MAARVDVLIDLDGPQLVLYTADTSRSVGILADADSEAERWLVVEIDKLELETLALGDLPMRDVFSRKPSLRAIDFDESGKARRYWPVRTDDVPPGILPRKGAPLPSDARAFLRKTLRLKSAAPTRRRVRFDGAAVHGATMELGALSTLTRVFQRLWTALGERLQLHQLLDGGLPSTALLADAMEPGSFVVEMQAADEVVFDKVLQEYQKVIALAFDNATRLAEELRGHEDLRDRLGEYLAAVGSLRTNILLEAPRGRVYIGHSGTQGPRAVLRGATVAENLLDESVDSVERTTRRGYFDEFGLEKQTFAFYDIDADESVSGDVASSLVRRITNQHAKEAAVGRMTRYRTTIERRGNRHTLVEFEKEQGELFER